MAVSFGIVTTNRDSLTGIMIIQSLSISDENEFTEALAEDATVEAVNETTKPRTISVEGLLTGSASASGAELTIDTDTWQIRTVEVKEENEGFKSISLEGVEKLWS